MFDWLAQYSPKELIGLTATVGGILFLAVSVVASQWASVRRSEMKAQLAEQELALKQQMIERGMSADEIAKVLAAGREVESAPSRCKHRDEPVHA